jgi:hypothetical protein
MFDESSKDLDQMVENDLRTLSPDGEAPKRRMASPDGMRAIYRKMVEDDSESAIARSIIQGDMDFVPPFDEDENEDKGQGDRFNFNTGEAAAIKNEAVSGYVDIFTTPATLASIPLNDKVAEPQRSLWGKIMAEEYTTMRRADDRWFPNALALCDLFATHGVGICCFEDNETFNVSTGGLDRFKFPRKQTIITSETEMVMASGEMSVTELYEKIEEDLDDWDKDSLIKAILSSASKVKDSWTSYEALQRDIKSHDLDVFGICEPVKLIYAWIKEFNGKVSFYITTEQDVAGKSEDCTHGPAYLFKGEDYYDSIEQAFQIFAFSQGNGMRLHSVRGLGYLIYQLCNATNILTCKMMDNARVESSLLIQPATHEDMQDIQLLDFGPGLALPPNVSIPQRPAAGNLNNTIIPAINLAKQLMDRSTGGLSSGNMMINQDNSRRTKLEVSAQLDFINKLNSFAISLFYGPLDKLTKEQVRRAFAVRQSRAKDAQMVRDMKARCLARGVPKEAFGMIDYKSVTATRIIGTGSRSSRIMVYDQLGSMYSQMDEIGRKAYSFDLACELIGSAAAERYFGRPEEKRIPIDAKIADLENLELLEGDWIDPMDGEDHLAHAERHLAELESGMEGVETGEIGFDEWTMRNQMVHQHLVKTLEMAVVPEQLQPQLNAIQQRAQQVGEIIVNGMRELERKRREGIEQGQPGEGQEGEPQQPSEAELKAAKFQQDMAQAAELHSEKLRQLREMGEQKIVLETQKALAAIGAKEASMQRKL